MRTRSEARSEREEKPKSKIPEFTIDIPSDVINEQVVLAAEFADAKVRSRGAKLYPPDAFYAEPHRLIQTGIIELERRKLAFDPATLQRLVPDVDIRIVESLMAARPDVPDNIEFHLDTLGWDWLRAQAARGPLSSLLEAIQNPKETPERVKALAKQVGNSFDGVSSGARFLRDPKEVVHQMMVEIRKRVAGEAFYPYGISGLDFDEAGKRRCRPGAAPGLVTIITAMSASGKTTLAAHMILGLARQGRKVVVGAWEVRAPMTLELITTLSLGWSRSRMLDGLTNQLRDDCPMTEEELHTFEKRANKISPFITFVDNPFRRGSVKSTGRVTNNDYLDVLEEHVEASGCSVALFDLFDRCLLSRKPEDEQEAVWRVLEMTDRLQIHTVLIHQQLLKGGEVRKDSRPSLAGIKGSSAYVDAGATIIAPHLPARFKDVPDDKLELFGLKMRFGSPFAVEFDWVPDTGQISGGRSIPIQVQGDSAAEPFGTPRKSRRK